MGKPVTGARIEAYDRQGKLVAVSPGVNPIAFRDAMVDKYGGDWRYMTVRVYNEFDKDITSSYRREFG